MDSYERLNYSIRPNKCIERKLIAELSDKLISAIGITPEKYIGFGSVWFTDFILFHKKLSIDLMISIENKERGFIRGKFNRPYSSVTVIYGDSTLILPDLEIDQSPCIFWLDYDQTLATASTLSDLTYISEKARPGTILFVTLNASRSQLANNKDHASRVESLRELLGDLIQAEVSETEISLPNFPNFICKCLYLHIQHSLISSGRTDMKFVPIATYRYSDGAPMLTIGGLFCNSTEMINRTNTLVAEYEYTNGVDIYEIDVPPLTLKEKAHLDVLLPFGGQMQPPLVPSIGNGFSEEQLCSYQKLYKYYPIYGEFNI